MIVLLRGVHLVIVIIVGVIVAVIGVAIFVALLILHHCFVHFEAYYVSSCFNYH